MKKLLIFTISILSYYGAIAQMANIKIDTIYYDKNWKAAQSPLFADYYRLTMYDANNPQAGYKVRDYYITGELQGEGVCSKLGINDDAETVWERKVVTYFKNGKLSSERTYENSKLNGDMISYYENGLIETKVPFIDGKIDGTAVYFTNNGSKCKKVEYVNGELKFDYYEVIDEKGHYSKFSHQDDKIKWISPSIDERQKAYSNGKPFYYYENNGLTISISMSPIQDYGRYYKFNVVVSNSSCEKIDVKLANVNVYFKYTDGAKVKVNPQNLHILPYYEYETKVRRRQNATKALVGIANGLAAAQAGYSASSTQINSGYAGGSASVGTAMAIGSEGWAVGAGVSRSVYAGASSTNINTVSYNGLAAYQASMMANAQYQAMSKEMLEERASKINDYLKDETVFPGDIVSGYFLIPMKISKATKYGGDICADFNIESARYSFTHHIKSSKEINQHLQEISTRLKNGEISQKEAQNLARELILGM